MGPVNGVKSCKREKAALAPWFGPWLVASAGLGEDIVWYVGCLDESGVTRIMVGLCWMESKMGSLGEIQQGILAAEAESGVWNQIQAAVRC